MRAWIETGVGCESDPACFVPAHALHAGIFCAAALLTAGAASLVMGVVLLNYMAYFVGSITSGAVTPLGAAACAWFPWSLVRIASFVTLGVALAEPLILKVAGRNAPPKRAVWIAFACAGLVADVVLKAWLAPQWPPLMRLLIHG
jgi:hypothetical protein